jgi:hypothetical protein
LETPKPRRMKKIYFFSIGVLFSFLFLGCSKDFLKRYEDRIEGVWDLVDVDRIGFNGSTSGLPFRDGRFIFSDGGSLQYVSMGGDTLQGSWNIRKRWMTGNCYTDDNGNYSCEDRNVRSMQITAINFITQDVRSEYFDEIKFTGTDRFKAYIYSGFSTYVFRFRR